MSSQVLMFSKRKALESAEKDISKFKSEKDVVRYLNQRSGGHPYLRCGYHHRLDGNRLETDIKGLVEKFRIHGYEDRGARFQYLQSILRYKFAHKSETFPTVMRLLILMSESPTSVLNMKLKDDQYVSKPDSELNKDVPVKHDINKLSDILSGDGDEESKFVSSYSSDSELSDWQLSDSEDLSEKLQQIYMEKTNMRLSKSFSEFSNVTEKRDPKQVEKEMKKYWASEMIKCEDYLSSQLREVELIPLQSQPIISSLLSLQSKFGEYWEWKNCSHKEPTKQLILEEDIIREVLWKITDPTSANTSIIFTEDWKLKPELMISSLSRSMLASFMEKYATVLRSLETLHNFVKQVELGSMNSNDLRLFCKPSKIYRAYANSLSEIFNYIRGVSAAIEKNLKKECWKAGNPQPATTLTQMDRQLQECIDIITTLKCFHDQSVNNWNSEVDPNVSPNWLCSIKLLSCLEMFLNLQIQPKQYGVVLFIFSKCLLTFFEEIRNAFDSLEWDSDEFYFKKDSNINISDCDFWATAIIIQPYEDLLKKEKIVPLVCLQELLSKVLIIFKTLEMIRQLDEDFRKVIETIPPSANLIQDFLLKLLPDLEKEAENKYSENPCSSSKEPEIDYATHFRFLGLEGSFVTDAFSFIVEKAKKSQSERKTNNALKQFSVKTFLDIQEIPIHIPSDILNALVQQWIHPHCRKSQISIQSIFKSHNIEQGLATFREIILEGREDFAKAVACIAQSFNKSEKFRYEDPLNRNPKFQALLDECYPEGRDNIQIDFQVDSINYTQYKFNVSLNFPLNIILSPKSVDGYTYISLQLQKVRNCVWRVTALKMKECNPVENVALNRALLLRFALIHYCSSIRAFLLFKIFNKTLEALQSCRINDEEDLDAILKVHEVYLNDLEMKIFKHPIFLNIIVKQMVAMTQILSDCWLKGIRAKTVVLIEDTLRKCWSVIGSGSRASLVAPGADFVDLSHLVGPPPTF